MLPALGCQLGAYLLNNPRVSCRHGRGRPGGRKRCRSWRNGVGCYTRWAWKRQMTDGRRREGEEKGGKTLEGAGEGSWREMVGGGWG